jgi:hypothetical protein
LRGSPNTQGKTDAFSAELGLLIKRYHENLSARAPRGASGKVATLSETIKCAAQEVFLYVGRRLVPPQTPKHIREAWATTEEKAWLQDLAGRALSEAVVVADVRGHLDAVSLTAYAIARFSGVNWADAGLKCPIDAGVIDREYFQKQYLSGPDIVTADGWSLAHRVLERVDPSFGREREPLDPKRLPKWAQVQREHFHRQKDRLKAKAEIFGSKWDPLKQQYPDLAAEIEGGGQHPDPPHDSSS